MTLSFSHNQPENTYVIDAESGAEMARLIDQDRIMTQAMGGLFSEQDDLSSIFDVLDIGCGPGGWVLDVAHHYPEMEVTGIDISTSMISYAQAYAQVRQLPNAHFQVMNAVHPLDFPDGSFDLVNARTIAGFLYPENWPSLIAECQRVLRPGGILRLTELEWGFSNKPGLETFCALFNQALARAGRSFSPTGRHIGVTPMLGRLLWTAGFQAIRSKVHVLNYSAGTPIYGLAYADCKTGFLLLQPFLISTEVASQQDIEHLYEQAINEMCAPDFCALSYVLTAWGEVPKADQVEKEEMILETK